MLLVTTRGSHRWLPPGANVVPDKALHEIAAQAAYEEAGVVGTVSERALGTFHWTSASAHGAVDPTEVTLFALHVDYRDNNWPERGNKRTSWFAIDGAARVVEEPRLARLIESFIPFATRIQ